MIYAYDQWAQMPVKDLYDSQMMAIAINAAKDVYDEKKKDLSDLENKYIDFYSPFQKDMARYKQMMSDVRNVIDSAYARGVDVLRSPEGRSIINRAKSMIDPAEYNMMKLNAKYGETYKTALAKLRADGRYSQDMENYRLNSLGLPSFDEFSTFGNNGFNTWSELSPTVYKSLQELTEDWYDKRTPYQLTADKAKQVLGKNYDPRAKYTGFLDEDLMNIAGQKTPGWQGSFYSDYYRDLARKQVAAEGGDPNNVAAVEAKLQRNIADSQQKWLVNPVGDIRDYLQLESLREQKRHNAAVEQNRKPSNQDVGKLLGWTGRRILNTNQARIYNNYDKLQSVFNSYVDKRAKGEKVGSIHNFAWKLYRSSQDKLKGDDLITGMALAANMQTNEVVDNNGNIKRPTVVFSDEDNTLGLTNTRAYAYAYQGYNGKATYNIPAGLENWLKQNNIKGYIYSNDVSVNHDIVGGYDVYDLNVPVAVDKDVLLKYYGTVDQLINKGSVVGLKLIDTDGRVVSPKKNSSGDEIEGVNDLNWQKIDKVIIPSTRTIYATALDNSQINTTHDNAVYSSSIANKREGEHLEDASGVKDIVRTMLYNTD